MEKIILSQDYLVTYNLGQDGEPDTNETMSGSEIFDLQRNAARYGDKLELHYSSVPRGYVPHYSV